MNQGINIRQHIEQNTNLLKHFSELDKLIINEQKKAMYPVMCCEVILSMPNETKMTFSLSAIEVGINFESVVKNWANKHDGLQVKIKSCKCKG